MSPRNAGATALRVLAQLRRDPRTIALVLGVPTLLITLMRFIFDHRPLAFQHVAAPLVGLFPFTTMFLVTSITMLRERTTGTLERLMTLPLAKLDLLAGYGAAFAVVAAAQASLVSAVAFGLLGVHVSGPVWAVILLAIADALLGMALGLLVSAFARTEFQAVQFMPAVVFPQFLLCGLFVAREQMAHLLYLISYALPLTYAYDAIVHVTLGRPFNARLALDVTVLVGATVLSLVLSAATLRRRTD